jgi:biopolymer transport protein ExbD
MNVSPMQRRKIRAARNQPLVDMNLVSLIDIFTILIFFLLSNSTDVEILPNSKAVKLPESIADKAPREAVVVVVSSDEILVQGHKVASVAEVLATEGDLIEPLKAELDIQASHALVRKENTPENQPITIMGDKGIPYRLLRKVMITCARANYSEVSFAVQTKSGT